jgi:hypothetical protein
MTEPNAETLEDLTRQAAGFESMTLIAYKPTGDPWGAYWDADGQKIPVALTENVRWASWFSTIHNLMPWLLKKARGPQWTPEPPHTAGTWIARTPLKTTILVWDGRDEVPTVENTTALPTFWLGPIPPTPY